MFFQENWSISRKGLFLVLVPQIIGLIILAVMYVVLYNAEKSAQYQAQARAVIELIHVSVIQQVSKD